MLLKTNRNKPKSQKSKIAILFLDLSNAFNKINRNKLYSKLASNNFPTDILTTIQILYQNAALSPGTIEDKININTGVLQGGILSPLLFNYYINDLIVILQK